jgi:hypothetical protein
MKIAILAAMLLASACTQTPAPVGNSTEPAPSAPPQASNASVMDERALWAAEALYNVPAQAYVAADSRGALPVSVKTVAKAKLTQLYMALTVARTAYAAGNSKGFLEAVSNMKRLKSEVDVVLAFYTN